MTTRWQVGDVRITRIAEMVKVVPINSMLPEVASGDVDRHRGWLSPHYVDGDHLLLSVHALVVESQGRRIIVDTCVGNGKPRPFPGWSDLDTPFLHDLEAAGYPPETIDTVLCTHLHFDHVGWNTMLVDGAWRPTFPNARYLLGRTEWDHWSTADGTETSTALMSWNDSVQPVVDAGLVDLVASDHRLTDEVWLEPTPGHSPGHHSVVISSVGQVAVITGDIAHSPLQLAEPGWLSVSDFDHAEAEATRRSFRDRHGNRPVLIIGTHYPDPTAGYLTGGDDDWRFGPDRPLRPSG